MPPRRRAIAIEREELSFDLRPIADGGDATISATYHLDNGAAATVTTPLVFVCGGDAHQLAVTFDRASVTSTALGEAQVAALPSSWNAPRTTPAIDGGLELAYRIPPNLARASTRSASRCKHRLARCTRSCRSCCRGSHP